MEKSKAFANQSLDLSKPHDFFVEYDQVKGYRVEIKNNENQYCFLMTKNSFYRQLIGQVPVISVLWSQDEQTVQVSVAAHMEHGMNAEATKLFEKLFDLTGAAITRKIVDNLFDPLFGKNFCDEALLISEGAFSLK